MLHILIQKDPFDFKDAPKIQRQLDTVPADVGTVQNYILLLCNPIRAPHQWVGQRFDTRTPGIWSVVSLRFDDRYGKTEFQALTGSPNSIVVVNEEHAEPALRLCRGYGMECLIRHWGGEPFKRTGA